MQKNAIVISFVNVKGGVGKTTISSNTSHILSCAGYKVLHVDLDPQGSSSELLSPMYNGTKLKKDDIISLDIFKLLSQPTDIRKYIFKTKYENLEIIPNARGVKNTYSNGSFDKRMELLDYSEKYTSFYNNLNQIRHEYDFIIIDGQPSMNDILKVSIIASDYVVSPAAADIFNIHTVDDTLDVIEQCNKEYGRDTSYAGFFLNAVPDLNDPGYQKIRELYLNSAQEYFIDIPIRHSKSLNKASILGLQLWLEYALENCVQLPNPCKDLINLLADEEKGLGILGENIENINKLAINANKKKFFSFLNLAKR